MSAFKGHSKGVHMAATATVYRDGIGDSYRVTALVNGHAIEETIVTIERGDCDDDDALIELAVDEWTDERHRALSFTPAVEFVVEPHEQGLAISVPIS